MTRVNPPYLADVVGSFLRPKAVSEARAAFYKGEITREALTEVEDREIAKLVDKVLANGLTAMTDGEFRRAFWHLDFLAALGGIRHVPAEAWLFASRVNSPRLKRSSSPTGSISRKSIRSLMRLIV